MKQKKSMISVLTLILSVLSLILSTLSFFRPAAQTADASVLQNLREENAALRKRLDDLTLRLDVLTMSEDENAWCHLLLDAWQADADALILDSAFAQVQLSPGSTLTVDSARLVLLRNGAEICGHSVILAPGDACFELTLTGTVLPLPELADDDHLELLFEVTLSNGQRLTASAGGWYQLGGELYSIVG